MCFEFLLPFIYYMCIVLCACTHVFHMREAKRKRERERKKNEANRIYLDIVFLFFSSRIDYRMIGFQLVQFK